MPAANIVGFFCEDIREEKAGTDTLIGIFPDNVKVPSVPFVFPRLALYVRINIDPSFLVNSILLRIQLPDGTTLPLGPVDQQVVSKAITDAKATGRPLAGLISRVVLTNFVVPALGQMTAVITLNNQDQICASAHIST